MRVRNAIGLQTQHVDFLTLRLDQVKRFYTDILGFKQFRQEPKRSSLNFPVKSPYGSPRSVKLLIPPTCLAGEARCEAPRLS